MSQLPVRDKPPAGVFRQWIVRPVQELVLAVRDLSSPEVKEIGERKMIGEIKRYGETGFVVRNTGVMLGAFLAFNVLVTAGQYIHDHGVGSKLTLGRIIGSFLFITVLSCVIGGIAYGRNVKRLKAKYPEEFEPDDAPSNEGA